MYTLNTFCQVCHCQRLIEARGGGWVAAYKRLGRAFNCWVSDKDYIVNNRSFDAEREHIFWLPFVLGFQLRFDFKKRTVNICHGGWVSSEIQFDWDLHKLAPTLQPPPHNKRNTYLCWVLYMVKWKNFFGWLNSQICDASKLWEMLNLRQETRLHQFAPGWE